MTTIAHAEPVYKNIVRLQNLAVDMECGFTRQKYRTMHLGNTTLLQNIPYLQMMGHYMKLLIQQKRMDDKLTFSKNIQLQVNKANSAVVLIIHTFNTLVLLIFNSKKGLGTPGF